MMMTYMEARRGGMLINASVSHPSSEKEIDAVLLRIAAKDHPGVSVVIESIEHFHPFLRHVDYMRAVFPAVSSNG